LSAFWFGQLGEPHHLVTTDVAQLELPATVDRGPLAGRTMLVRKTKVVPIECVVRGYLSGSGWAEYQRTQSVCGVQLPGGLTESQKLPEPIFTPATKEESGHDMNITFDEMANRIGRPVAEELCDRSIKIYKQGAELALAQGILIADTKFEWGWLDDKLILIDEALTPDSSRFWPADQYAPGHPQASYDKQFVRDWLIASKWDKNSPPPELPVDIVTRTREKYVEAYERLTGSAFAWK
jgi:phosphoribosylaminoimidazole-succinocarboxamide synthase